MRALLFRRSIPRYLTSRAVFRTAPSLWSVGWSPLGASELPLPTPDRDGWVRLRIRLSGICGSDLSALTGGDSLYLDPEATYPFVPGHEIVAEVDDPGSTGLTRGERVAVWSILGCRTRAIALCSACTKRWDGLCSQRDTDWPNRGLAIGFNSDTGGGWSEACLAHESQLWPLPETVSDEDAVLLDPAASALAALLRTEPARTTLVIGGGTIGLLAASLHRALDRPGDIHLLARHQFQADAALGRGVDASVIRSHDDFRVWADNRDIRLRRIPAYGEVFTGSFDRVIVAAGSHDAFRQAMHSVRPGGTIVLTSSPAFIRKLDLTPFWYREITLRGIYAYGPVPWGSELVHPFDILIPAITEGSLDLRGFLTHQFVLPDYREAVHTALRRSESGAIKVAMYPSAK